MVDSAVQHCLPKAIQQRAFSKQKLMYVKRVDLERDPIGRSDDLPGWLAHQSICTKITWYQSQVEEAMSCQVLSS